MTVAPDGAGQRLTGSDRRWAPAAQGILHDPGGGEGNVLTPWCATSWTPIGSPSGEVPPRTATAGHP